MRRRACASSTATATAPSAPSARASCRRMPPSRASTRTYMLKEIHEQPRALADTLSERVANGRLLEAAFGPARHRGVQAHPERAHRGLRHELPRRQRGALLHRADLQDPLRGRHRQRVPLPQSAGAAELAVRDHLAVGRDRRHARRAAPGQAVRLPLLALHLQRAGELAGARVRARHAHARGSGDRRRLDQGLYHAARGAGHAGRRARAPSRRGCRARARPGDAPDRAARRWWRRHSSSIR